MTRRLDRQGLSLAGRNRYVEVDGIGGDAIDRAALSPEISADDFHVRAIVVDDFRNVSRLHFLITRRGHLERGRKIAPQLKSVHPSGVIALGHFLVNDAAAGSHPLHVARADDSVVAHAVAVLDAFRRERR